MEPILELATRITSHLWFLRALCPQDDPVNVTDDAWLKRAAPTDYAGLRNLLDLTGDAIAMWSSTEWKDIEFNKIEFPVDRAGLDADPLAFLPQGQWPY